MDDITNFLDMTHDEQVAYIEDILMEMWEDGLVDLVGFDENNEPLFSARSSSHE